MMIKSSTPVSGSETPVVKPEQDGKQPASPVDRVTVAELENVDDRIEAVRTKVGLGRTVRLAQIEAAVRGGMYQPSPSQIASRLLDAAELDAHLAAMMRN